MIADSTAQDWPTSLDKWRSNYDSLSWSEQIAFFDSLHDQFPDQNYCTLAEARQFAALLPKRSRVLELGGWDGHVASKLLSEFLDIRHWYNYEVCTKAIAKSTVSARYTGWVPDDYPWKLEILPDCNVLFAAHVLPHLRSDQIRELLGRLNGLTHVYVEADLPSTDGRVDWNGSLSANVLEVGWPGVERLFAEFGFSVTHATEYVRFFEKRLDYSSTQSPQARFLAVMQAINRSAAQNNQAPVGANGVGAEDLASRLRIVTNAGLTDLKSRRDTPVNDVLMIMQPRDLEVSIASLKALPINRVWFRAFAEADLAPQLNQFIERTNFEHYLLVSDDVIISPKALQHVRDLLRVHPVATGYCRLAMNSDLINLTRSPVTLKSTRTPRWDDYDFMPFDEVSRYKGPFVSWFGGWALTGMRRDLWLKYPFEVNPHSRAQSDHQSAYRMAQDQQYFISHPGAYIEHLKPECNVPLDINWLVGHEKPAIIWDMLDPARSSEVDCYSGSPIGFVSE